jgi:integrase
MAKLTDRFLAALRTEDGRKDRLVFDTACPGLGVRVTAKGTRTFIAQWTDPVTRRKIREPIGVWGNITIEQAREGVRARLGAVAKGLNPRVERLQRRAEAERERAAMALTFEALIEEWKALHLSQRRPRYAAEAVRAIRSGLPDLVMRPAAAITRSDAVNAIDRITLDGKRVAAARVKQYARACYSWGLRRGKVEVNPFAGLPFAPEKAERERVLSDDELRAIWMAAASLDYPWAGFYQLSILTLQRRQEVAGMRWSELADDLSQWSIPGSRMKNGQRHEVHLSGPARDILCSLPRLVDCEFVFSTTGESHVSGYSKAKRHLDTAIVKTGVDVAPWVPHDLRRTGVTTLAVLGFDSIVVDKLLAHQPGKLRGVAGIYQRHDFAKERAKALDAWAAHVTGTDLDNVVQLSRTGRR